MTDNYDNGQLLQFFFSFYVFSVFVPLHAVSIATVRTGRAAKSKAEEKTISKSQSAQRSIGKSINVKTKKVNRMVTNVRWHGVLMQQQY